MLEEFINALEATSNGPMEYFFILDAEGNIIYHPNEVYMHDEEAFVQVQSIPEYECLLEPSNEAEINEITDYDGEEKYVISQKVDTPGWQIVGVINQDVIVEQMTDYLKDSLIVFTLLCGLLVAIAMVFIKRKNEKELEMKNNLFNTAISSADTFVLDYDILTRSATASEGLSKLFNLPRQLEKFPESLFEHGIVAHGDRTYMTESVKIGLSSKVYSFNIRLKDTEGDYLWYSITFNNVFDNKGTLLRTILVIKCIDKEIRFKNLSILDQPTGVFNKQHGTKLVSECISSLKENSSHALFVFDIDNFKDVNDTYGHAVGDTVILEMVKLIKVNSDDGDILFRTGGDEFVMLAINVDEVSAVARVRNILEMVSPSPKLSEYQAIISIGITISCSNTDTYQGAFEKADKALYDAKNSGKSSYRIEL